MTTLPFATTGRAPRIERIEALAFHDAAGRIRHMHHAIVLEGAQPRSYEALVEDAKAQAKTLGVTLGGLRILHVQAPFSLAAQHRVDVKKGVLVEMKPPTRPRRSRVASQRGKR